MYKYSSIIQNIRIDLNSIDADFLEFAALALPKVKPLSDAVDATLVCNFDGYESAFSPGITSSPNNYEDHCDVLVSSGVRLGENTLNWSSPRIKMNLIWKDQNSLSIKCKFYERPDHTIRRLLLRQSQYKYNNYQVILRAMVYMPLFHLMEQLQGKFVLHGAAIANSKESIILCGLNGIGKSTLALHMVNRGYSFLGDNYLTYDRLKLYAFPEACRVSQSMIQELKVQNPPGIKLYGKYLLPATSFPIISETRPNLFLLLVRGKTSAVKEIQVNEALEIVLSQSDYLAEYPEHSIIGLTSFRLTLGRNSVRWEKKLETTRMLLNQCRIGLLQLGENEPVDNIISRIENFSNKGMHNEPGN